MLSSVKEWIRSNKVFLSIIVIAFIIRFYFFSLALAMQGSQELFSASIDSENYLKMAHWLLGNESVYPEGRFFDWGIGHAAWLAVILYLFKSPFAVIFIQMVLSAVSCGIVYQVSSLLIEKKSVAVIASILLMFSETSINLSILILSDSLYFFLFISGLYFFIKTLQSWETRYAVIAGILFGCAVLVRPIGQFWFLMLIVLSIFVWRIDLFNHIQKIQVTPKQKIGKLLLIILLIVSIMTPWVIRNYVQYGIPTYAFTSARGIANIASWTEERLTKKPSREIQLEWYDEYKEEQNVTNLTYGQTFSILQSNGWAYVLDNPIESAKTYLINVGTNLTELNMLHRVTLPEIKHHMITYEEFLRRYHLNYLNLILSIIGLIMLVLKKEYTSAILLGAVYLYYTGMVGSILWQGSRIFYPGQIAAVILISITLVTVCEKINSLRFSHS